MSYNKMNARMNIDVRPLKIVYKFKYSHLNISQNDNS